MDAVSGATERPCPHRSRVVTHGYEDIYSRSTPDAKIFQSGISPKVGKNPRILSNHKDRENQQKSRCFCHTHGRDFLAASTWQSALAAIFYGNEAQEGS